ncbi:DUF411 domain-containing protein [Chitinibacteraceae bacterium HSL-7]
MKQWIVMMALAATAVAQAAPLQGTMFKSPTCGCCGAHAEYLRANGIAVTEKITGDTDAIKKAYGTSVAPSCHTIVIGGYAVEGHVPAAAIAKLLKEKPAAKGIAVPGMPADSPGMGDYKPGTIEVVLIGRDGSVKPYGTY